MKAVFRLLLLVTLVFAGVAAYAAYRAIDIYESAGPLQSQTIVTIEPGEGPRSIASRLIAADVIENRIVFLGALRLTGDGARLKAGEFRFEPGMSMQQAIAHIVSGKTVVRRLTIPEGRTTRQILDLITAAPALEGEVQQVGEGELLPETYHYSQGDKRWELVRRMRQAMRATVKELWPGRDRSIPVKTMEEAIILASIVEKETGVPSERARVAGVFVNRLRKGMRLQSDPTVIYAVTGGQSDLGRPISKADLAIDSPFNTYRVTGLPPQPIANPGRAAIAAVLNPAKTNDLYFVADGSGGHAFAETLAEHNRNVRRWRKLQKDAK
ncbi:endolytic transglycosylase MltG [Minwuia sp.]|uniref:endolytic transglycosylase MltG n=1 Tax=Minwuia sp. TaxID=2493630 RepID=UPI003A948CB6